MIKFRNYVERTARAKAVRAVIGKANWAKAMAIARDCVEATPPGQHFERRFRQAWKERLRLNGFNPAWIWLLLQLAAVIVRWWLERREEE